MRALYYLPYRAAIKGEYRFFTDTWGVDAHNVEVGYTHPFKSNWILDLKYRFYTQTKADFYEDIFPYQDAQNFMGRDKELSTFTSNTVGAGLSYLFTEKQVGFIKRGSMNLQYDHIMFDYDDFRDVTKSGYTAGNEPFYSFSANVTRISMNIWY